MYSRNTYAAPVATRCAVIITAKSTRDCHSKRFVFFFPRPFSRLFASRGSFSKTYRPFWFILRNATPDRLLDSFVLCVIGRKTSDNETRNIVYARHVTWRLRWWTARVACAADESRRVRRSIPSIARAFNCDRGGIISVTRIVGYTRHGCRLADLRSWWFRAPFETVNR